LLVSSVVAPDPDEDNDDDNTVSAASTATTTAVHGLLPPGLGIMLSLHHFALLLLIIIVDVIVVISSPTADAAASVLLWLLTSPNGADTFPSRDPGGSGRHHPCHRTVGIKRRTALQQQWKKTDNDTAVMTTVVGRWRSAAAPKKLSAREDVSVEHHRTSPTPSNAIVHLRRWTPMTIGATRRHCHLDFNVASLFAPAALLLSIAAAIGRCRHHQTPPHIARFCTT
jgi:hypothetical protein